MNNNDKMTKSKILLLIFVFFCIFFTYIGGVIAVIVVSKNYDSFVKKINISTSSQSLNRSFNDDWRKTTASIGEVRVSDKPMMKDTSRQIEGYSLKESSNVNTHPGYSYKRKLETREDFYQNAKNFTAEEIIELNNASHSEFSHSIYHESNKTVHYSRGVFLAYNATKKEYYFGKSGDTISQVAKLLKAGRNPLKDAFRRGDTLRIKILTADGKIFRNNVELELDIKARFKAINI